MHMLKIRTQYVQMIIDILLMTDSNSLHPHLSNLPDRVACLTQSLTPLKSNFR
jgi:hypothetical protein